MEVASKSKLSRSQLLPWGRRTNHKCWNLYQRPTMGEISRGGWNTNKNRVRMGRGRVEMANPNPSRIFLREIGKTRGQSCQSPILSLKLRRIGISRLSPTLGSKLGDFGDCPQLFPMFLGQFPPILRPKVRINRGKINALPYFLSRFLRTFGLPISTVRSRWIGDLSKSWSWFSVGIVTAIPTYLAHGCRRPTKFMLGSICSSWFPRTRRFLSSQLGPLKQVPLRKMDT